MKSKKAKADFKSPITTHVLDTALGKPASGIAVTLSRQNGSKWTVIGRGKTDADGRIKNLIRRASDFGAGRYQIVFAVAPYFRATKRQSFYPQVSVEFEVTKSAAHYHVPLLLSPFGYSTYRGS